MKYLVGVDDCFVDRPGGMGRVAWDIAQLVERQGHDVTMVCIGDPGPQRRPAEETRDNIRIVRASKPALPAWHPGRLASGMRAVQRTAQSLLAAEQWDVVHLHSIQTGIGLLDALGDTPRYVATIHSPVVLEQRHNALSRGLTGRLKTLLGSGVLKRLERRMLFASSAIHCLSRFTRSQLDRYHGVGSKVVVIPHWRRPDLRRELTKDQARRRLGWPTSSPIVFTVRIHAPRYGIDLAIRAIAPLARAGRCQFFVAGDGPLRPYHERLAADLGTGASIRFLGRISDADLALAYQAADVFLLPTRALECFGLIIIEALSFGCPVLASDAGAIGEILEPVLPDHLFPAGDVDSMRSKLDDYLDGRLARPAEAHLTDYVAERYSEDTIAPDILSFIQAG